MGHFVCFPACRSSALNALPQSQMTRIRLGPPGSMPTMHTPSQGRKDAVLYGLMESNIDELFVRGSMRPGNVARGTYPGGWLLQRNRASRAEFIDGPCSRMTEDQEDGFSNPVAPNLRAFGFAIVDSKSFLTLIDLCLRDVHDLKYSLFAAAPGKTVMISPSIPNSARIRDDGLGTTETVADRHSPLGLGHRGCDVRKCPPETSLQPSCPRPTRQLDTGSWGTPGHGVIECRWRR